MNEAINNRLAQIDERLKACEEGDPVAAMLFIVMARGDIKYLRNLVDLGLKQTAVERALSSTANPIPETGDIPKDFVKIEGSAEEVTVHKDHFELMFEKIIEEVKKEEESKQKV